MPKEKPKQVILQDNEYIKYVIIEMNLKENSTKIMSTLDSWNNIRIFASSIGVTYRKIIEDGGNPIATYKILEEILISMLDQDYDIKSNEENIKGSTDGGDSNKEAKSVANESVEATGVVDNKQPVSKDDHKSKKEDKKSIKSKNKNKKRN